MPPDNVTGVYVYVCLWPLCLRTFRRCRVQEGGMFLSVILFVCSKSAEAADYFYD